MKTSDAPRTHGPVLLPRPAAYRVPWQVDRRHAPTYRLVNVGPERLWGVSLTLSGSAVMRATPPGASCRANASRSPCVAATSNATPC